eukprot:s1693_g3.t2
MWAVIWACRLFNLLLMDAAVAAGSLAALLYERFQMLHGACRAYRLQKRKLIDLAVPYRLRSTGRLHALFHACAQGVFCKRHGHTSSKYPDLHRHERPILMRVFLAGYTVVVCALRLLLEVGKRREEEIERARKLAGEIEHEYDLFSERDLINFLLDADVRLVRLEYLQELQAARRLWPRRQEAEQELLRDGRSALVTREELQRLEPGDGQEANAVQVLRQGYQTYFDVTVSNMAWSTQAFVDTRTVPTLFRMRGKRTRVRIVSVSHSWEAMQHPDPWGFQLRELCERLVPGKREHETWVFVDFMSLYQYKRTPEQQKSFHHAMANMHCLYAHAALSEVVRLDVLTSPTAKPFFPKPISIYSDKTDRLEMRPFKELVMNDTPYAFRGWCRAEIQWSSLLHDIGTYAPMSPADFSQAASSMQSDSPKSFWQRVVERTVGASCSMPARGTGLKFTHRSDLEKVIELQERVFKQVAPQRLSVVAHRMSPAEMLVFARALPQYRNLRVLWIRDSKIGEVGIRELLAALQNAAGLVALILSNCDVGDAEATLIADFLKQSRTLQYLRLDCNHISTRGAFTLAASLKQNRRIKELGVNGNPIDETGREALKRSAEKGPLVLSTCSLETTVGISMPSLLPPASAGKDQKPPTSAGKDQESLEVQHQFHFRYDRRLSCFSNAVSCITFTMDGQYLVSGTGSGDIKVWDSTTWAEAAKLRGARRAEPKEVAISPSQRWVVVCYSSVLHIFQCGAPWQLVHSRPVVVDGLKEQPEWCCVAFSPMSEVNHPAGQAGQDNHLAAFSNCNICLMDYSGGWNDDLPQRTRSLMQTSWPVCLAYTGDGYWIICGFSEGLMQVWNAFSLTLEKTLNSHDAAVNSIAASPPTAPYEPRLVSCSKDQTLRVWHVNTWLLEQHVHELRCDRAGLRRCAFSALGTWLVSVGSELTVWRVCVTSRTKKFDLQLHQRLQAVCGTEGVRTATFSNYADVIAVGSHDGVLGLWRKHSGVPPPIEMLERKEALPQPQDRNRGNAGAENPLSLSQLARPMQKITPQGLRPVKSQPRASEGLQKIIRPSQTLMAPVSRSRSVGGARKPSPGLSPVSAGARLSLTGTNELGSLAVTHTASADHSPEPTRRLSGRSACKSTTTLLGGWQPACFDEVLAHVKGGDGLVTAGETRPVEKAPRNREIVARARGLVNRISLDPKVITDHAGTAGSG